MNGSDLAALQLEVVRRGSLPDGVEEAEHNTTTTPEIRAPVENEEGDLGAGGYASGGRIGGAFTADLRELGEGDLDEGDLGDLMLPAPALPPPPTPAVSNSDRRSLASATFATPHLTGASHPRTRFTSALNHSPRSPSNNIPLRPILNPTSSPAPFHDVQFSPQLAHQHAHDHDGVGSPPSSPVFAPRDDDEPHPERTIHEERTPHPLYTPMTTNRIHRARRLRRVKSIASSRTSKTGRTRVFKSVWRSIRRHHHHHHGGSSSSSSSSSGSTSSSTGDSSSHSNSTWGGWRFWKNSSSGSSASSNSSDSDDEWEPPTPHFTLLTPCLARPKQPYPPHLLPSAAPSRSQTPTSGGKDPSSSSDLPTPAVFDLSTTSMLTPALERLQAFWLERRQVDGISGDLGAGAAGAALGADQEEMSFFPDSATPPSASTAAPPLQQRGGTQLKGERKAARAEELRLGKRAPGEEGPAWWLDVMCPSVSDMKELRKILPLHPLTMEDILHQETREKIEAFPALGYYFIIFRALDETYFQYTSPEPADKAENDKGKDREHQPQPLPGSSSGRRGRVDIVEGVGGKEGVEGVGVGAVNLYLVVFGDGILSFHFEDISKHTERVQGKLQQFGISRAMSSHWIAYGLMDSIVDAFFPLIDFIEAESNEVDTFLSDPLNNVADRGTKKQATTTTSSNAVTTRKSYDPNVVGIVVEAQPSVSEKAEDLSASTGSQNSSLKKATVVKHGSRTSSFARAVILSAIGKRLLPKSWICSARGTAESMVMVDLSGYMIPQREDSIDHPFLPAIPGKEGILMGDPKFDRLTMLKRIADARKLVTGLNRLLGPKSDVVKGLRKRTKDENLKMFGTGDSTKDIAIYIGDLFDHIVTMQQSLNFYDAILSHDHPAYLGILRLSLSSAKAGTDVALVKLYIVTLTFLPINILTGLFSGNVRIPHNGDRYTHLEADGSRAPHTLFFVIIGGVIFVAMLTWFAVWLIFKSSKRQAKKRGSPVQ